MSGIRESLDRLNLFDVVVASAAQLRRLKSDPEWLHWTHYVHLTDLIPGEIGYFNGARYVDEYFLRQQPKKQLWAPDGWPLE